MKAHKFAVPLLVSLVACGEAANAASPAEQAAVYTLADAFGARKPLRLHLLTRERAIVAGFATGYNGRSHAVDTAALRCEGTNLTGRLGVTLVPDFYVPADGKTVAGEFQLVAGAYTGRVGDRAVTGTVTGAVVAQPDAAAFARGRLRILGALRRLQQAKGPNWQYALDMNLTFPWPATTAQLATIVPDYRRYSAVVTNCALARDGSRLHGAVEALVDYGGQNGPVREPRELHEFTVDAVAIGETVGGTCEIRVGDIVVNERVLGTMDYTPPPAPANSTATIRLHDATQGAGPAPNHATVRVQFHDGKPVKSEVVNPATGVALDATVEKVDLRIDDDLLTGVVEFTLRSQAVQGGRYRFAVDATIEGDKIGGYWRGALDGVPILTKSSKLGGRLVAVGKEQAAKEAAP